MRMRHKFTFDAGNNREVIFDKKGIDGKKAFYLLDSTGKLPPTKHPNLVKALLTTKGSVNFHIKMYAEDRVSGLLNLFEFRGMCIKFGAPEWFYFAVEKQKNKLAQQSDMPEYMKHYYAKQNEYHAKGVKTVSFRQLSI